MSSFHGFGEGTSPGYFSPRFIFLSRHHPGGVRAMGTDEGSAMKPLRILLAWLLAVGIVSSATAQICPSAPPPTNGCSTMGLEYLDPVVAGYRSLFTGQCNQHDSCYSTLGKNRPSCDNAFRDAMREQCDSSFNRWLFTGQWLACKSAAEGFYAAVDNFGGNYYPQAQQFASRASANYRDAVVTNETCGTTPQRTFLYSADLLAYVNNSFALNTARAPSTYEFFVAINRADPAGDALTWRIAVDQYAKSQYIFSPPWISYQLQKTLAEATLTGNSSTAGVVYTWHVNNQVLTAPRFTVALPEPAPFDRFVAIQGFLVARAPNGVRNMIVVDQTIKIPASCDFGRPPVSPDIRQQC